ncbi:MAG: ribokinase, partial [Acidimicrobiales bacterium]|nr:ribokinase [Acidimicrobiales bacterium]
NQAVAAARAEAPTVLVAAVGHDQAGAELAAFLADAGVDTVRLTRSGATTGTAVVTVAADGSNSIVVVPGANGELGPGHVGAVIRAGDVVVTQLEIPLATAEAVLTEARQAGGLAVLNFSPARSEALDFVALADLVVVNDDEMATVEGRVPATRALVVTQGAKGAELRRGSSVVSVGAPRVRPVDTTGAGDCLLGVMAAWLAGGAALEEALRAGCMAASIQVTRPGAAVAMPLAGEIRAALGRAGGPQR